MVIIIIKNKSIHTVYMLHLMDSVYLSSNKVFFEQPKIVVFYFQIRFYGMGATNTSINIALRNITITTPKCFPRPYYASPGILIIDFKTRDIRPPLASTSKKRRLYFVINRFSTLHCMSTPHLHSMLVNKLKSCCLSQAA